MLPIKPDPQSEPPVLEELEGARPGDILLFTNAKGLNRSITWLTRSNFYHVGIFKGDTHVVEARPRGVVCRDLTGPDGDKAFVVIPAPGGEKVARKALQWAESQIGDGYDPINAAAIVLDRVLVCWRVSWGLKNRYSCGELVAESFRQAGYDLFPCCAAESIVPGDFEKYLPLHLSHLKSKRSAPSHEAQPLPEP
ncbi:MAG: Permuted papain-like amidase enzyme YaeF/YiiX, family [Abditibacteriota bacterium]|nr:Permuted papain-like amidase enzyme YaeF/YiiX, family [Abditibacteriota bacterium]